MIFVVFLLAAVVAHNWVNSPARSSPFASTVFPTIPSQTGEPHVQVAAGQMFPIEWVVAHDSDTYFVLLKNDDNAFKNMLGHSSTKTTLMDDYLNNAPTPANTTDTPWQKYHYKYNDVSLNAVNSANDSYFTKCIRPSDAGYITRPSVWTGGSFGGAPSASKRNNSLVTHCFYKQNLVGTVFDRRAQYTNPKYPWIIAMHRYRHFANTAVNSDFAMFQFPKGTPPGNYIVHWGWRGYYDVIDVEIVAGANVPLPYGNDPPVRPANTPSQYKRVDHCTFQEPTLAARCTRILTDAKTCMQTCDRSTDFGCQAVAVVPIILPPTVYSKFRSGPGNVSLVPSSPMLCDRNAQTLNAKMGDRLCYPLQQRMKDPLLPVDSYRITNDPEDPGFYSTCYFRVKLANLSAPAPAPQPRPLLWQFHQGCADCDEAATAQFEHYMPRWNVSKVCKNCALDGPKTVPVPTNFSVAPWTFLMKARCVDNTDPKSQYKCVNTTSCSTSMSLYGADGDMSPRDCYELARRNVKCGRVVWMDNPYQDNPARCMCWTNTTATNSCCGACVQGASGGNTMWQLENAPPF